MALRSEEPPHRIQVGGRSRSSDISLLCLASLGVGLAAVVFVWLWDCQMFAQGYQVFLKMMSKIRPNLPVSLSPQS